MTSSQLRRVKRPRDRDRDASGGSISKYLPTFLVVVVSFVVWQISIISSPSDGDIATAISYSEINANVNYYDAASTIAVTTQQNNTAVSVKPKPQPDHDHELAIQQNTIDHLKSLPSFPKKFHLIWPDKDILNKDYEMLEKGAKNLKRLNHDWEFVIHDDADINHTINTFQHPDVSPDMLTTIQNSHIVEKTDAYRLLMIFQTGGLYGDIDRVMNKKLDFINVGTTKMILPTYYDINFAQDLFGSSKGNKLILNVFLNQNKQRITMPRKEGWLKSSDHLILTHEFSKSLEKDLFGRELKQSDAAEWNVTRHVLTEHSQNMVVTYRDIWCDGLLVTDFDGCKSVQRTTLYDAYNVVPWARQVDALWEKK